MDEKPEHRILNSATGERFLFAGILNSPTIKGDTMTNLLDQIIAATSERNAQRLAETVDSAVQPVAVVTPEIADEFGMRELPNTVVQEPTYRHSHMKRFYTWDEAKQTVAMERGTVADITAPVSRFKPIGTDGAFAIEDRESGKRYSLSDVAMAHATTKFSRIGLHAGRVLAVDAPDILCEILTRGINRVATDKPDKQYLIRTRGDQIRAILSDQYAIIDHLWYLDVLQRALPECAISHVNTNGDNLRVNMLIPDQMREETDSQYGAGISGFNSEIGAGSRSSMPFLFRYICANGLIMGKQELERERTIHKGNVDLSELEIQIRENLSAQIPILETGHNRMMGTRNVSTDIPARDVLAGAILETERQIGRPEADAMILAYAIEQSESRTTGFDVIQSVTRAAQGFESSKQETAERFAGDMLEWNGSDWERVFSRAESIGEKQLKRVYQTVSA